jgi:hypothetical protein
MKPKPPIIVMGPGGPQDPGTPLPAYNKPKPGAGLKDPHDGGGTNGWWPKKKPTIGCQKGPHLPEVTKPIGGV